MSDDNPYQPTTANDAIETSRGRKKAVVCSFAVIQLASLAVGLPGTTVAFAASPVTAAALPEIFFIAPLFVPLTPPFIAGISTGLVILVVLTSLVSVGLCWITTNRWWQIGISGLVGAVHGLGIRFTSLILWNMVG
jgi:hypothetical protein